MESLALNQLVEAAANVAKRAYAPYSHFQVGAAVLTESGEIFAGCNVENASYGLTICAERGAVCAAVAAGHRKIVAVAVVTSGGASPCGACRQVLNEFGATMEVILIDADDPKKIRATTLDQLLPESFGGADLHA